MRTISRWVAIAVAAASAGAAGMAAAGDDPGASPSQPGDAVVVEWNAIAVETLGATPPFPSTRLMAIVQLAVFEAVNAITRDYRPYLGTVTAPRAAAPEAAAVAAAHGVLRALFPAQAGALDQKRAESLARLPDGQARAAGIAAGEAAAAAMLADRSGDGSAPLQFYLPSGSAPYLWQPTPSCTPAGGAFFHWRSVKPFAVRSSAQFRAEPPPALTSERWARDYDEVRTLGDAASPRRPPDRTAVARIYASQPPHQGWNAVARQLAGARRDPIARTARTLAMLNLSLSDGHITVFESKYHYTTWRPETAIRRGAEDGNPATDPDPAYTPLIASPCFPGYPSAHGSGAGAASAVLARAYGEGGHDLTNSTPSVPGVVLHYASLEEIVRDVSDARVYGGIHFRTDQDAAERLGREVARYALRHVLQPARGHEDED